MAIEKGILLAGGAGSRLYPLTAIVSKQLQPVYDKPMIYYALSMFLENRIRDICLISTGEQLPLFRKILGDGSHLGVRIEYRAQPEPGGIAQAFLIAESFIEGASVALALGDNIFHSSAWFGPSFRDFGGGALIFAYQVQNPERYGVVEFSATGEVFSLEEKPSRPKSRYVVPGLYLYDADVTGFVKELRPSARGELEITDLNLIYLRRKALRVVALPRGFAWLDAGTSGSLHEASSFVQTLEKRQGIKIGCPEEAALRAGLIDEGRFEEIVKRMPDCEYRDYLKGLAP
ncbi:MAG TPA: glucose-1-phosphate thymidylyltransferase RfbA [Candidatus Methylacidiphilales bacterium]|jgi:glucose-1-phosphate thymidylyltransferase|nr:glucose-1-phosphate thymidylyltransferase RfbA [Candidatus Methylacidiphilales bacterium]